MIGRPALALLMIALIAASCGDSGATGTIIAAEEERIEVPLDQAGPAADAVAAFGWDLYRTVATDDANVVVSPHSIGVALAMARAGAAGETASELDGVLHLGSLDDPHRAINAIDLALSGAAGERERPDGSTAQVVIDVANALWAQEGFGFEPPFLTTLAQNYGAGVQLVDYVDATEEARERINEWVADQTADRIDELIGPGVLSPMTRAVLTNAVYLKAPWERPFTVGATAPGTFTRPDGSTVEADLMALTSTIGYTRLDQLQAIELAYVGGELAMVVIVPDVGTFATAAASLDGARFRSVTEALRPIEVDLRFPAFGFTTDLSLVAPLQALGLRAAFDPERADFSAMTGEADLFVSEVAHQAFIAVDETGTEAGAATAVVMDLTAAPSEHVQLVIDRPFLFAITHVGSGSVLFAGHVVDGRRLGATAEPHDAAQGRTGGPALRNIDVEVNRPVAG